MMTEIRRETGTPSARSVFPPARFAVLVSGRGTNLAAIIGARDRIPAELVGVLASRPGVGALAVAEGAGVPTAVVARAEHASSAAFSAAVAAQLEKWAPTWVVLAGFMHVLSDEVVRKYARRIVNIHPSLLPKFPGLHPHRQALRAGEKVSGCTVHFVEAGPVDSGRVVAQVEVPVLPGDTEETLAARVLEAEHTLYPATLARLFAGELSVGALPGPVADG